jgi:hypothetical protein
MKTAMQELIEYIEMNPIVFNKELLLKLKELTFKEKEQIIDAHIEGQRVFDNHQHTQWTNDQAEQYYNQTYNQNK